MKVYRSEYEIWAENDATKYIYTHRNSSHFPMASAVAEFNKQKEEGFNEMQQRYRSNYIQSISGATGKAAELLNLAMSEDKAMSEFDKIMTDTLNDNVSKGIQTVNGFNLEQSLQASYKSLSDCVKKDDATKLNILLEEVKKAAELLQSNGNELVILLEAFTPLQNMGDIENLYQQLKNVVNSLEGKSIKSPNRQLLKIAQELQKLTGALVGGASLQSLNGYLKNLFSTELGEYVVSRGVLEAAGELLDKIDETLTGSSNLQLEGAVLEAWKSRGSKSKVFKTDNSFSNLIINLNEDAGEVNLELGLSTKWYKTLNSSGGVSIGKETSFMNRVDQLCQTVYQKYLAYNSLAAVGQNQDEGYKALKAAIIAKNLDVLISGLGYQKDFSQFIVVNGKFYSIWQIIQAVQKVNTGGSGTIRGGNDPITVSATGLSKITELTAEEIGKRDSRQRAYQRAKRQDNFFRSSLELHGKFYPQRLTALIS